MVRTSTRLADAVGLQNADELFDRMGGVPDGTDIHAGRSLGSTVTDLPCELCESYARL